VLRIHGCELIIATTDYFYVQKLSLNTECFDGTS